MRDSYVVELDIFHQLHCLNSLRKTLFPARYQDQFTDFFTADGQRNYTSNDARHYGKWSSLLCSVRKGLTKIARSLRGHNPRISHVPWRHCYDLLAMDTLGSASEAKIGGYTHLPGFRGY
jgi:Mycotoxin biosynthesis protein UstYa